MLPAILRLGFYSACLFWDFRTSVQWFGTAESCYSPLACSAGMGIGSMLGVARKAVGLYAVCACFLMKSRVELVQKRLLTSLLLPIASSKMENG